MSRQPAARFLMLAFALILVSFSAFAQDAAEEPIPTDAITRMTCADGTVLSDGLLLSLLVDANSTLVVTAMGASDYDPVLAIASPPVEGDYALIDAVCNDDEPAAAEMWVNLPTISTDPAESIAQLTYVNETNTYASIVIGVFNAADSGEVAVQIEGLSINLTTDNQARDVLAVTTPGVLALTGASMTIYTISMVDAFDPLMAWTDAEGNILVGELGDRYCDDAGSDYCYEPYVSLVDFSTLLSNGDVLPGGALDAMMNMTLKPVDDPVNAVHATLDFRFTSSDFASEGAYVVVVHIAPTVAEADAGE